MILSQATAIANRIRARLAPFCERIEIAGGCRRLKPEVHDIELVAIPRTVAEPGLFGNQGTRRDPNFIEDAREIGLIRKGYLGTGRYVQFELPEEINLDLFMATRDNWGLIYAIRTGSAAYSHEVLAKGWVRAGYHSLDGHLIKTEFKDGKYEKIPVREERDLFDLIGLFWADPWDRNL